MRLKKLTNAIMLLPLALICGSLAYACPDPAAREDVEKIVATDLYYTRAWPVLAGGFEDLSGCLGVNGFVVVKPDFSFNLVKLEQYGTLEVTATSEECDVVLLVNTSRGLWYYNDGGCPR